MVTIQKIVIIGVILVTCCSFVSGCSWNFEDPQDTDSKVAYFEDRRCYKNWMYCHPGTYNTTSVRCETGYYVDEDTEFTAICTNDGWTTTGSDPCKKGCPREIAGQYADMNIARFIDDKKCSVTGNLCHQNEYYLDSVECMTGYYVNPAKDYCKATCKQDGGWGFNGGTPCFKGCPRIPVNSYEHVARFKIDDRCTNGENVCPPGDYNTANVRCETGYYVNTRSDFSATCTVGNGRFSWDYTGSEPCTKAKKCKADDPILETYFNVQTVYGSKCDSTTTKCRQGIYNVRNDIVCKKGFAPNPARTLSCSNGDWNTDNGQPKCTEKRCNADDEWMENGLHVQLVTGPNCDSATNKCAVGIYKDFSDIKCIDGFVPNASRTLICTTGYWITDNGQPVCTEFPGCPRILDSPYEHVARFKDHDGCSETENTCDRGTYDWTNMGCEKGYYPRKNSSVTATCSVNGWNFTGGEPCKQVKMCKADDPKLKSEFHVQNVYGLCNQTTNKCRQGTYSALSDIVCEPGFVPRITRHLRCRNGDWDVDNGFDDVCDRGCPQLYDDRSYDYGIGVLHIKDAVKCPVHANLPQSDQNCRYDTYSMTNIKCKKGYYPRTKSGINATCRHNDWRFHGGAPCPIIENMCPADDPATNKPKNVIGVWSSDLCNNNTDSCLESRSYEGFEIKCDIGFVPSPDNHAMCAKGVWTYYNSLEGANASENICNQGCSQFIRNKHGKNVNRIVDVHKPRCPVYKYKWDIQQRCEHGWYDISSVQCMYNYYPDPNSNFKAECDRDTGEWKYINDDPCKLKTNKH